MCVCASLAVNASQGLAADITITSGTTVTTQQTLTDPGDTGTVESGGTIDVIDEDGLFMNATDQSATNNGTINLQRTGGLNRAGIGSTSTNSTILNNGTISVTGDDAYGIAGDQSGLNATNAGTITTTGGGGFGMFSLGNGSILTNTGTISTTGTSADGIYNDLNSATISNSGTITTTGDGAYGMSTDATGTAITNSGTIATSGANSHGIESDVGSITVNNTGRISVGGDNADGIDVDGNDVVVRNSGSITAVDADGNGIDVSGNRANVVNTGLISVSGPAGEGIDITGADAVVVNSGQIYSTSGPSISVDGANAALTLQRGTVLQGSIALSAPASATFNYAVGRSAILTFNALPNTINTSGLPSWTSGTTLAVVDPSDFRLSSLNSVLTSLTGETASAIEARIDQGRFEPQAFVATHGAARSNESTANPWSYWAGSFGGVLDRSGTDGFNRTFGGLLGGADRSVGAGTTVGALAGFSIGNTESDDGIHEADTYSVFGGAYAAQTWQDLFADVAFTLGYLRSDDDIRVLNNSVSGGLQDLSLGYDYIYVSPSVRVGTSVPYWDGVISPSLRLRYAGLWQGGSSEQSTLRFKTDNRSLHVLEVRGQTAYDFAPVSADTGHLDFSFKGGVDTAVTLSDSADASVNGAAINLSLDDDVVVRGFGGLQATWATPGGLKWSAGFEGGYDSAQTVSAAARLGLRALF